MVSDAMYQLVLVDQIQQPFNRSFYGFVGQCTVAMIVNDMITLGALPLSVAMHLAVAESDWFKDETRRQDLVEGWKLACDKAGCVWGGGETPTLKGLVIPGRSILSGSAMGIITPKERLIKGNIQSGDSIVLLSSSGLHANGYTLAREIAVGLPSGYQTLVEQGLSYGEALLKPTIIYVKFIEECLDRAINIHYAVNITGHGWRKLMRAVEPFVYIIDKIPKPQPVFRFIQEQGPVTDAEMYSNYNMGAGFAIYVPKEDEAHALEIADGLSYGAMIAGHIEKRGEEKKVIIKPKNLEYDGSSLGIR
ncbi:MAG: AIR synthase-related protein [Patescibacteria group bacterium]